MFPAPIRILVNFAHSGKIGPNRGTAQWRRNMTNLLFARFKYHELSPEESCLAPKTTGCDSIMMRLSAAGDRYYCLPIPLLPSEL
jgi:hypothetical protein